MRSRVTSAAMRRYLIVAAAALAAAGATVGITLATRTVPPKAESAREGAPPLLLDLGVRTDDEATALRRAAGLYDRGKRKEAAGIFARHRSLEARVGSDLAAWPGGFGDLRALSRTRPRSALVQLHYGLALYWRREDAAAQAAWRRARETQPDTPYSLHATDLLYPDFPRGIPIVVPSFPAPPALERLTPPQQFAFLARRAQTGGARDKLLYGVALQRLGHRLSARREFDAAAELAPDDPELQVAAAVSRFDKQDPSRAFSRLGPLSARYPKSQSVRFHLGVLLLWLGRVAEAERQLRRAKASSPMSVLGREAARFLERLQDISN